MIAVSCRWGWTRQNCCNVQHQRAIWKSSTAASEKAWLVARKTGRARRASLDLHRQNRERKAKHLTGERRETCAGAEDHAGKNVQGRSLRSPCAGYSASPSRTMRGYFFRVEPLPRSD